MWFYRHPTSGEGATEPATTSNWRQWFKEITLSRGNRARDQFAAFLLATSQSSSRCGINSPARVLGPALARQLWDTWAIGTERRVAVVGMVSRGNCGWTVTIKFGVSHALLGITTDVQIVRDTGYWVSGNQCLTQQSPGLPWVLKDPTTGTERKLVPEQLDFTQSLCMNEKWWLQVRDEGSLLVITNMQTHDDPVLVPIPDTYHVVETMSFNKMGSSQALILMTTESDRQPNTMLVVADVEGTFTAKSLQIVSSTQCAFPRHYFRNRSVKSLLLKKKSGQNVFIVETIPRDFPEIEEKGNVFLIQANGEMNKLFSDQINVDGMFHQQSSSLFSYYHHIQKRLDVWDCNDIEAFKRQTSPPSTFRVSSDILSGGGLVIFVDAGRILQVVEATLGIVVASIDILQPGCSLQDGFRKRREQMDEGQSTMNKRQKGVVAVASLYSQFVALCTVTHPRCGCQWNRMLLMRSSSLSAENLGLVVRLVWGWVVGGGPVRFFSVSVYGGVFAAVQSTLFTFGMSMLTLGVVSKHSRWWKSKEKLNSCVETLPAANHTYVIDRTLYEEGEGLYYSTRSVQSPSESNGGVRPSVPTEVWSGSCYCAEGVNPKWLVIRDFTMNEFVVANLLLDQENSTRVLPSPAFIPQRIFMNQIKEDEAVLFSVNKRDHMFKIAIVNLQEVWSGRTCNPIFHAEYCIPSSIAATDVDCLRISMLILQAHSERCFIVKTASIHFHTSHSEASIIQYTESAGPHEVRSANYHSRPAAGCLALTQLSERLYCVTSTPNTLEVWDCNNPTNALRIVDNQFCCRIVFQGCHSSREHTA
ncbi:hypothetical protein Pelo_4522 [Pelomyxa schiedti]|nr:hypothetical protein Pelo_4522 [Pelomyxa schiedti]